MADEPTYTALSLVGYREPDYSVETDPETEQKTRVELPGFIVYGFVYEGEFVQLGRLKAGNLMKRIAKAKAAAEAAPPATT